MDNENTSGSASFVWPLISIVVLGLGAWLAYGWYVEERPAPAAVGEEGATQSEVPAPQEGAETASAAVTYSSSGFSPATITVKRGGAVTWQSDESPMWVASDEHPSHTEYSGTSREEHCASGSTSAFDQCVVGNTYSFTFDKVGTWRYHNHRAASHEGQVVVVE